MRLITNEESVAPNLFPLTERIKKYVAQNAIKHNANNWNFEICL
jgi:hypothetical protein